MQFIEKQGLIANKSELVALLAFMGPAESEEFGGVGVRVDGAKLSARVSNGQASLIHESNDTVTLGSESESTHEWQIGRDTIQCLAQMMTPRDEVVFALNRGKMVRGLVRDAETRSERASLDLAGRIGEQMALIQDPAKQDPTNEVLIVVNPSLLGLLPKVGKAAGTDLCMLRQGKGFLVAEFSVGDDGHSKWTAGIQQCEATE
jgi:hypothetical protein